MESGAALLREALDIAWRIAELLDLFDRADTILVRALEAPLTRADLDLRPRDAIAVVPDEDAEPS